MPEKTAGAPRPTDPPATPPHLGRRLAKLLPLLLASSWWLACESGPPSLSETEQSQIEQEVRAALDAFADSERRLDAESAVSFLGPEFYMYADGTRIDGETVEAQIRATLPTLQRFDTTWSDIEVTVLGPELALVSLIFRDAITDAEGSTTRQKGPTTFVWRRLEGEWRILYVDADHYPDNGVAAPG